MSPSLREITSPERPVVGSGPGGRVEMTDIRAKLDELRGGVNETTASSKPVATYVAVAGVVVLVAAAFVFGRKRGRRKSTWVEIRRQ
ncbi:MAG: hypothetical protein J2P57_22910 [Acidimicrobiaceae bacterium]|nr:hypothetical protein [Acidimicrobiaceae bacterium]